MQRFQPGFDSQQNFVLDSDFKKMFSEKRLVQKKTGNIQMTKRYPLLKMRNDGW